MERRSFRLINNEVRQRAIDYIWLVPDGYTVIVQEQKRTLSQNDRFHAICTELEKLHVHWDGKPRNKTAWKLLLISAHSIATGEEVELVRGLEGEVVNLRESSAEMDKRRGSSLIEFSQAFLENHRP